MWACTSEIDYACELNDDGDSIEAICGDASITCE